jgi:hypothetical protein
MRGIKRFWREHSILLWFTAFIVIVFAVMSLEMYWLITIDN